MLNFQKDLVLLIAIASIFSGLLSPVLDPDLAAGTAGGGAGDDTSGDDTSGDGTDSELQPDPDPCLEDPNAEGCEEDPCLEDPTLEGCDDPCIEDPTLEGCEPTDYCDPSYPNICIPSPPPDLNCNDISNRNFNVVGSDPHGFDRDNDGIGCEDGGNGNGGNNGGECDPSYPEDCIPSPPPDLDCGDTNVPNNVRVVEPDPHRLDGDNNGIGCESSNSGGGSSGGSSGGSGNSDGSSSSTDECQGQADCFRGTVTEIVDGDTIDINNLRVRLALANTPERGESGYSEAIDFVESVCNVGTRALVDEDDGQKEGSFDRLIGLVYCGDSGINNKESLNELLLERGYAVIDQDFCAASEVSSASWAQRYGC